MTEESCGNGRKSEMLLGGRRGKERREDWKMMMSGFEQKKRFRMACSNGR